MIKYELFAHYRLHIILALTGIAFIGIGVINAKGYFKSSPTVEIVETPTSEKTIKIEVAGSIERPGVYTLPNEARVEDGLNAAGGISKEANHEWIEKNINRASLLIDGQKIYIPSVDDQLDVLSANNLLGNQSISKDNNSSQQKFISINSASQKELESLWGIGPVIAQNIIEQRPYSSPDDLVKMQIIKESVYEKIKDKIAL